MEGESAISLPQVGIAVAAILHGEAGIVIPGHVVEIGKAEQVGDRRAQGHLLVQAVQPALHRKGKAAAAAIPHDLIDAFRKVPAYCLLQAIGPFAIDMYLPALPSIGQPSPGSGTDGGIVTGRTLRGPSSFSVASCFQLRGRT